MTRWAGSSRLPGSRSTMTAPVGFPGPHSLSLFAGGVPRPNESLAEVGRTGVNAAPWLLMPSLNIGEPPWYGTSTNGMVPLNSTMSPRNEALEMTRPPPQPVGMDQLTFQSAWLTVPGMTSLLAIRRGPGGHRGTA